MGGLEEEVVQKIRKVLASYPQVDAAILYGSRARGDYRPGSDIDITLQGEQLDFPLLAKISNALDDLLLPYTVDVSLLTHIENTELKARIAQEGVKFYVRGS